MKDTIMLKLYKGVQNGKSFSIDFKTKSMKLNRKYLIKDGIPVKEMELGVEDISLEEFIKQIEDFYINIFYSSVPKGKCDGRMFIGKEDADITLTERAYNVSRPLARAVLEGELLCRIINGSFYWDEEILGGKQFWKSKREETKGKLILLRKELGL